LGFRIWALQFYFRFPVAPEYKEQSPKFKVELLPRARLSLSLAEGNLLYNVTTDSQTYRLLRVDSANFAVAEDDVLRVAEWIEPTPLPFAPESVLGVVSIQGRMFTVIDVGRLAEQPVKQSARFIVALRGDEQLALAVADANELADLTIKESSPGSTELRQTTVGPDNREVSLLDKNMLFASVFRGRERRQRML